MSLMDMVEGFFCPEGSSAPEPCEEGTYSSRPGLREASECTLCDGGRYCTGVGKTKPSGNCEGGFFCKQQSVSATPFDGTTGGLCPAGSFCSPGSAYPQPCPSGTFSNSTGLKHVQQCVKCPPGYYCLGLGSTSPTGLCSAGYYCSGGSASPVQHQVEEGHYSVEGAVKPEPCFLGTFQPVNLRSGDVCPAGYYCPEGTRHPHQYPCPVGTWSSVVGAQNLSFCSPCPAGFFCNKTGLTQPTGVCAAGTDMNKANTVVGKS
ncbi:hypothetical protein QTP70_015143 [Hemibagrus guttatus]|uniref:Uncharacterized protein n=1 Tax=Hemibagrus guttatus TaxID=175788 RepID=A0AAE0QSQ7_9TELE|nr:hypothetical protein QTP70_015143 [Hemibagrus guttatus]